LRLADFFFVFFISPWFIDPLFYKYEPLDKTNRSWWTAIEKVTQRAGLSIPRERMFLMRASSKTNQINAYVTGVGASKRVVVWDNTINKTTTDDPFCFWPRSGTLRARPRRNSILFFSVTFFSQCIPASGFSTHCSENGARFGESTAAGLGLPAVLLLIFRAFSFLSMPVESVIRECRAPGGRVRIGSDSRNRAEFERGCGARISDFGQEDCRTQIHLRLLHFCLYSHPPLAERLVFAHTYDPVVEEQQAARYIK